MFDIKDFDALAHNRDFYSWEDPKGEDLARLHHTLSNHVSEIVRHITQSTNDVVIVCGHLYSLSRLTRKLFDSKVKMNKEIRYRLKAAKYIIDQVLFFYDSRIEWRYSELPLRSGIAALAGLAKADTWRCYRSDFRYKEFYEIKRQTRAALGNHSFWLFRSDEGF